MTEQKKRSRRFGRYMLKRRIAKGGMAEIYVADYLAGKNVKKEVVLKKTLPTFADDRRFLRMFIDEARISIDLTHGNIAQVFDFGAINGEHYLAMEYIQGHSLSQLIRRANERGFVIPPHIASYIIMEVCRGLHYAHKKTDDQGSPLGIVHRDISPQNIMISYEGQVKLVDFGIAKARTLASKTRAGAIKGKYLYFSPEQAHHRDLDGRSDIFAAGIVLYEMITGERPFSGQLYDVLANIVNGQFVHPGKKVPNLRPSFEKIILRAMAVNPDERYGSALEMQEAAASFLYSASPRFTSAGLSHYIRFLFAEELVQSGITNDLPSDFLEQVSLWKKQPITEEPEYVDTSAEETGPGFDSRTGNTGSGTDPENPTSKSFPGLTKGKEFYQSLDAKNKKTIVWSASLLAAATIIFLAIVYASKSFAPPDPDAGVLIVESSPPGAEIIINGLNSGEKTPARIDNLSSSAPQTIVLRLEGYRDAMRTATISNDHSTGIHATLEEIPVITKRPRLADVEAEIRRQRKKEGHPSRQQEERILSGQDQITQALHALMQDGPHGVLNRPAERIEKTIPVQRLMLDIRRLPTLQIDLNRNRAHTLRIEGKAYRANPLLTQPSSDLAYLIARSNSNEAGAIREGERIELEKGVLSIHFIVPTMLPDGQEGYVVVILEDDTGAVRKQNLHFSEHFFMPAENRGFRIDELAPTASYKVSFKQNKPQVKLLYFMNPHPGLVRTNIERSPLVGILDENTEIRGATDLVVFTLITGRRFTQKPARIVLDPG